MIVQWNFFSYLVCTVCCHPTYKYHEQRDCRGDAHVCSRKTQVIVSNCTHFHYIIDSERGLIHGTYNSKLHFRTCLGHHAWLISEQSIMCSKDKKNTMQLSQIQNYGTRVCESITPYQLSITEENQ